MILVKDLSFSYSSGKGIFGIDFKVPQGSVMGYLGPNGAGKSTTIRTLIGLLPAEKGQCTINGADCFKNSEKIMKTLGYIPGEIAFPSGISCMEFLKYQCELRGIQDTARMKYLIERFGLDTKGTIKKFSKGMKQKVGIITAFMHDPEVLILDEPTSGLDPLMQNEFISLILEEKQRGKTILMSSHMFEEIERTCDNVIIIKDGSLVANADVKTLKSSKRKGYIVETDEVDKLKTLGFEIGKKTDAGCEVYIKGEEVDDFIKKLSGIKVTGLDIKSQNLEDIFMDFYEAEVK